MLLYFNSNMLRSTFLLLAIMAGLATKAQRLVTPAENLLTQRWSAQWIAPQKEPGAFGVYLFRKSFQLASIPREFIIHLSADNRYHLWVNGQYLNEGPQLGDPRHWHFESLDIAPALKTGLNVVAVQVIDFGGAAPLYQMGKGAALIVQGDGDAAPLISTPQGWRYVQDTSTAPVPYKFVDPQLFYQFYAAGPTQRTDLRLTPTNWQQSDFNDADWLTPSTVATGAPHGAAGFGDEVRELMPRTIPLLERTYQPFRAIRRVTGLPTPITLGQSITIPARTSAKLLLDQQQLTVAYPEWTVDGGAGAAIRAVYAEAVFTDINKIGHRDSVGTLEPKGVYDVFFASGKRTTFSTLAPRTFRYVQIEITTEETPLTIEKMGSWFVGYPFERHGRFSSSDPTHEKIYQIGWHTARLCAFETYMDCPYWERLQYVGDTRIQALVSYYASGDDRLARNAIQQFHQSLTYDGLTYSRHPSEQPQFIPNYALVWVLMVYDFWMYHPDDAFVKPFLPGMQRVLEHFERYRTPEGLIGLQAYWDFLDHTYSSKKVSDESASKSLAANSLFLAMTLRAAADLFANFGQPEIAQRYRANAQELTKRVQATCWNPARKLYADSPDQKHFSMHVNVLAVLTELVQGPAARQLLERTMSDPALTPTTLYFDFYLGRALQKVGAADLYDKLLLKWKSLLDLGLTTFPEGVNRSECHAWSASPNFEMPALFGGIQPASPGFKTVRIEPQLGNLTKIKTTVPHWAGEIAVELEQQSDGWAVLIGLPPGITGHLIWKGKKMALKAGVNQWSRL
jgi:hypothetical protein